MRKTLAALALAVIAAAPALAQSPDPLPSNWSEGNVYTKANTKFHINVASAYASQRTPIPDGSFDCGHAVVRWHSGGISVYRDVGLKWIFINLGGQAFYDAAFFEVSPAFGDHFNTVTQDGTARTRIETSVPFEFDRWYKFDFCDLGGSWEFYIDDQLVSTHTTNLPGTDATQYGQLQIGEGAYVAKKEYWQVDFDQTSVE